MSALVKGCRVVIGRLFLQNKDRVIRLVKNKVSLDILEKSGEIAGLHELRDEKVRIVVQADPNEFEDVIVLEIGHDLCLLQKVCSVLLRSALPKRLDRDLERFRDFWTRIGCAAFVNFSESATSCKSSGWVK